jgi:DNA-binding transcriptional LysR family regulator
MLPKDLSNALQQLDDLELDRLVAASHHELQRRGRPMTRTPEIQAATHIRPGERASKRSIAKDQLSERRQRQEPNVTLTQGQVNAVLATFKAGIAPSRIARQFGISQSDVRKVLASESQRSGRGG